METALAVALTWLSLSVMTAAVLCVLGRGVREGVARTRLYRRRQEDRPWTAQARTGGAKLPYGRRRKDQAV